MELGNDGLKVFYGKGAFIINGHPTEFERELEQLCVRFGLYRCASGYEMQTGIRDLAFDRLPPQ